MATSYNFKKDRDVDQAGLYMDISLFFSHLTPLGVDLQGFELKPDGTVTIRTALPLAPDQIPHLGLVP